VHENTIFVVGIGLSLKEIWRYESTRGWMQCRSLVEGRSGHCTAFVGESMYICGGRSPSGTTLKTVEAYSVSRDSCFTIGRMIVGVFGASCVSYKRSVYVFGGQMELGDASDTRVVQVLNTRVNAWSRLVNSIPAFSMAARAVQWRQSVILLNAWNCLVFDLETETWKKAQRYEAGREHFGIAVMDEKMYLFGGHQIAGRNEKDRPEYSDEIVSVKIDSVINDDPTDLWMPHGRLPRSGVFPASVQVLSTI
jgi:N-acetylneuraminic acid mutarotase